jgi:putative ubiquitin-RnfH superfamily antitoxin RatB of RatAB toxin-antitoxin module
MSTVELIYATLAQQSVLTIAYNKGDTIEDVIIASGLLEKYSEINLKINKVGIYNQVKKLDELVNNGDRIEIYRALISDPKEVRRKRAVKQKEEGVIK